MIQFISSKRFIAETLEDININSPDYVDRLYSWIEYGLGMMGMSKYYQFTSKVVNIKNHRGDLPCNLKFLHSFWVSTQGSCGCGTSGLSYIQYHDSPLVGNDTNGFPSNTLRINVEGSYINTDLKEGNILVLYKGVPRDAEGYPLIPDNPFVFEALIFYIIYRLALKGVEHPIIKMGEAYQQWERLYPRASNDVDWMDSTEMQEFTAFWNSPYMGNIVNSLYTT